MKYLVKYRDVLHVYSYYIVDEADDIDHVVEQVWDALGYVDILEVWACTPVRHPSIPTKAP